MTLFEADNGSHHHYHPSSLDGIVEAALMKWCQIALFPVTHGLLCLVKTEICVFGDGVCVVHLTMVLHLQG